MRHRIRALVIAAACAAIPLTAATAASAAPARDAVSAARAAAQVPSCVPSPYTGRCFSPTVSGTPWSTSGDNIRPYPNTYYSPVGFLAYGQYATVYCYAWGQTISGDPYWDWVGNGYIADAVLNTGGTITGQVFPCVSGLHG